MSNIRLRTNMPDGTPIDLYNNRGGDYISIPEADWNLKLYDIVTNHTNLSPMRKEILIQYFVYAMAVYDDENGDEQPYLDLTLSEFNVLYSENAAELFQSIANPADKYYIMEIPKMDDDTGEREMLWGLGLGYAKPNYTMFSRSARAFKLLEPSI
jgi:hypothetical protein